MTLKTPVVGAASSQQQLLDALAVATMHRLRYDHRASDLWHSRVMANANSWRSDLGRLAALGYATSLVTRWRPDSALGLLQRVVRDAQGAGDARTEAEALMLMAPLLGRRGQGDSAQAAVDRASQLLPLDAPGAAGRACGTAIQLRTRSLRAADSLVQAGLRAARVERDSLTLARCLLAEGMVLEARGSQSASGGALNQALLLAGALHDQDLVASIEQWMAYAFVSYGSNVPAARRYAERAIARATRTENPITVAWARLNLAQVALRVGDAAVAWRNADEAMRSFRRLGDAQGEANVAILQAQADVLGGRLEEGVAGYARAEAVITAVQGANATLQLKFRRAMALIDLGRLREAEVVTDSVQVLATAAGVQGILRANLPYLRGRVALKQGRFDEAITGFQRFLAVVGSARHDQLDGNLRVAEAHALAGRLALSDSFYTIGMRALDGLRGPNGERADILRLMSGQRFDSDTDLGVATIVNRFVLGGQVERAFSVAESERARWLWIQRSRRHALDTLEAAPVILDDRRLDVAELQSLVPPRTAVVSFVTGRGGEPTTAFVMWDGGVRAASLAPIDSMRSAISRLTTLMEDDRPTRAITESLGTQLLQSVVRLLPPTTTHLRIVPDGQLYHVPFDALVVGGQPLVMRYVTSTVPSVRLALAPSQGSRGGRVLAFGDPVFDSRYGLSRLRGSEEEVRAVIRAARDQGTALLRTAAQGNAIATADWRGISTLHLATHARVEDHGLFETAIYLSGNATDDGRIGTAELARWSVPVDLVVLSACRTVGGFVATGEGVQGLVGPLLEAGARAVAATYWDVRDRSLVQLMRLFYEGMATGATAGDALARAKRVLIQRGVSPRTWASVGIVGDDRVRPFAAAPNARPASESRFAGTNRPRVAR
ncbi:MAG: CHAT domain-containing protein [Gemmatimonadetes bacterium]|nr:CHAT domain-containing protein [Gemmatimonadota bacterium]